MTTDVYDRVELIPWDPTNGEQFQRMHDQRLACGWRYDEVPEWKEKMLNGQKFLYWILPSDRLENKDELVKVHLETYPKESGPLIDTATIVCNTSREPTNRSFLPIGHIALELLPDRNVRFSFPTSTIWIMSLYVSWPLQAAGLGRSAMAHTERIAALPPLSRTAIALDTIGAEFQRSETGLRTMFDERGRERPRTIRTTKEWYERQGYEVVEQEENGYTWTTPEKGERIPLPVLYMLKKLV